MSSFANLKRNRSDIKTLTKAIEATSQPAEAGSKDDTRFWQPEVDKAKEGIILPLFCPSCSKSTKPHLDKKWFVMYGHCFNCQVDFEHELKKQGKLQDFENQVINDHLEGTIQDFESWFDELINEKQTFITEAGDVEKWDGSGKTQLLKYKEEALKYLQKQKRK